MLKKITKLQGIGLLHNGTPIPADFERVTLVYAENGRGKSTLATLLRACALGDATRIQARKTLDTTAPQEAWLLFNLGGQNTSVAFANGAWNSRVPQVIVFDVEFVEQNVYSGQEVRPDQRQALLEFALGDQSVKLKQQIDDLTKQIADATLTRGNAEKRIAAFSRGMPLPIFVALQVDPDAQAKIDALRKLIETAKNATVLTQRQTPALLSSIDFDIDNFFGILAKNLDSVEKTAEAVVREHFSKHSMPVGIENWVSTGQVYAMSDDCPFCGQKLEGLTLVAAYQGYFNKAYVELKQQVSALRQRAETNLSSVMIDRLASAVAINAARIEAWKDQLAPAIPGLPAEYLHEVIAGARKIAVDLATQKQGQPLDTFGSPADKTAIARCIEQINGAITTYNRLLGETIAAIQAFERKIAIQDVAGLEAQIKRLEIVVARQHADSIKAVADYQTADARRKRLDSEKTDTREHLDKLMIATLAQYQDRINKLLVKFGAGFTIEQMKPNYLGAGVPRTEYGLCLRKKVVPLGNRTSGGAHFGSTLSEGDKRTLAFAFFLAKIEADPACLAEQILVLDDPVSSFDRNRRAQTIDLLVKLSTKCAQMIVLSHDAYFIREQRDMLAKGQPPIIPRIAGICRVQGDYSAFVSCDIDEICASDYYRHHRQLSEYVAGTYQGNIRDVAKAMRPFLEGYYHRRFPGLLPTRCMFGGVISAITHAPKGAPIGHLMPRVGEMSDLNDYAGRFHHDTNPGNADSVPVTDGELKPYVERALALVYQG